MNRTHHLLWFLLLVGLLSGGCITPRIDWAARVGNYTYDQAVIAMGPPDKYAQLKDGAIVAEWLTQRGYVVNYGGYGAWGYGPYCYGPFYPGWPTYTQVTPNYYLRLVFGPDGKLQAWKRFAR